MSLLLMQEQNTQNKNQKQTKAYERKDSFEKFIGNFAFVDFHKTVSIYREHDNTIHIII